MNPSPYSLIDFGNGRKLERFGSYVIDRPCPAAEGIPSRNLSAWTMANARFDRTSQLGGRWQVGECIPDPWLVSIDDLAFELKLTDFGHVGIFPEQMENWQWIRRQAARRNPPLRVLNLFAYTGGATMAALSAGADVVHVDSARNVVNWARGNVSLAGLAARPIRWIVDDCRKFVQREARRGQRYDAIILDPPSYGHGPGSEPWKLNRHLMPLLRDCARLVESEPAFVLLTCHSPGWGPAELSAMLQDVFCGGCRSSVEAQSLVVVSESGDQLHAGACARYSARKPRD